jgi:hypothetical protein
MATFPNTDLPPMQESGNYVYLWKPRKNGVTYTINHKIYTITHINMAQSI